MDSTVEYDSKRVYSLHIFKDTPGSDWTNPSVHTFPLSSVSYNRCIGRRRYPRSRSRHSSSRDGLTNLYKLPSEQLSFVEKYIQKLNLEVEENKSKLAREWEDVLKKEEQERAEKQKAARAARAAREGASKRSAGEEQADRGAESDPDSDGTARGAEKRAEKRAERKLGGHAHRGCSYGGVPSPWGLPPPPPPPFYGSPPQKQKPINPAVYETKFTVEAVELIFIPEIISLKENGQIGPYNVYRVDGSGDIVSTSNKTRRLEIFRNKIAPESFTSFSVVLSRCEAAPLQNPPPPPVRHHPHGISRSPARSYYSYSSESEDDEDDNVGVEHDTTVSEEASEEEAEGSEDPEKKGNENEGEKIETESKAGDEGEDCGDGVVYINMK